jgi:hypothetical protein
MGCPADVRITRARDRWRGAAKTRYALLVCEPEKKRKKRLLRERLVSNGEAGWQRGTRDILADWLNGRWIEHDCLSHKV